MNVRFSKSGVLLLFVAALAFCMSCALIIYVNRWRANERAIDLLTDLVSGKARHRLVRANVTCSGKTISISDEEVLNAIELQLWDARSRRMAIKEARRRIEIDGS